MGELGLCTIGDIAKTVATQLIVDITTDVNVPFWLIRLLHNKITYWEFFGSRCYLLYFDASQWAQFLSPFLLPFVFAAFLAKKRRIIMGICVLMPLFFIFNPLHLSLYQRILAYQVFYMLLAIVGCITIIRGILRKGLS